MPGDSVTLAYLLNWFILIVIVTVPILVGVDARKRGLSWTDTMVWVLVSTFLFPIGLVLYFLRGRPSKRSGVVDE